MTETLPNSYVARTTDTAGYSATERTVCDATTTPAYREVYAAMGLDPLAVARNRMTLTITIDTVAATTVAAAVIADGNH